MRPLTPPERTPGVGAGGPPRQRLGARALTATLGALALSAAVVVAPLGASASTLGPVLVQRGQSNDSHMVGPRGVSARLRRPTRRGDLLTVGIVCGVWTGGMAVPHLSLPAGWHRAVHAVGGIQDGLEAAVYDYPDNPGGIKALSIGTVARGSNDFCTTFFAEYKGVRGPVRVGARGAANASVGQAITVRTATPTHRGKHLVLLVTTDGTEIPHNAYRLPRGFRPLGEQHDGRAKQPGTYSDQVTTRGGVKGGTVSWDGPSRDNCGVVVALSI